MAVFSVARCEEARSLWRQRIAELRAGGMSLSAFAREHNLSLSSLSRWNRRFDDHLNLLPKPRRAKSLDPKEVPIPGKDRTEVPQWVAVVAADKEPDKRAEPRRSQAEDDSISLSVGRVAIYVGPRFDPTLFADILRVVKSLC